MHAQDLDMEPNKYRVWVTLIEKPFEVQGTLDELNDTTMVVSNYKTFEEFIINNNPTIELRINNIDLIEARKKNRLTKGVVLGAVSGFVVGGIIGLARGSDEDFTAGEKAMRGGVTLAIPGALIGLLVGSIKVSFPIEGSIINYNNQRKKLQKYSTR